MTKFNNSLENLKNEKYNIATLVDDKTEILVWKTHTADEVEQWYGYGISKELALEDILFQIVDHRYECLSSNLEFDIEYIASFLVYSFDLFTIQELSELIEPVYKKIEKLQINVFNDRKLQRKLITLHDILKQKNVSQNSTVDIDDNNDTEDVNSLDYLINQIRLKVSGKKFLFVTNRADPELKNKLEHILNVRIIWCDGNIRKIQDHCKNIVRKSYDYVLLATSFQSHETGAMLARATKLGSVPYVRVSKGRFLAVIRTLARNLCIV